MAYRDPNDDPKTRAAEQAEVDLIQAEGRNRVAGANTAQECNDTVLRAKHNGRAAVIDAKHMGWASVIREFFATLGPGAKMVLNGLFAMIALSAVLGAAHLVFWSYNSLTASGGQAEQAVANTRDRVNQTVTGSPVEVELRRQIAELRASNTELLQQSETRHALERSRLETELATCNSGHTGVSSQLTTCRAQVTTLTQDITNTRVNIVNTCNQYLQTVCPYARPLTLSQPR